MVSMVMIPHGMTAEQAWLNRLPRRAQSIPPDPTKRDLVWGNAYPCLQLDAKGGQHSQQCGGMMIPAPKCYVWDHHLWRKFECNKCGRIAHDTKVENYEGPDRARH